MPPLKPVGYAVSEKAILFRLRPGSGRKWGERRPKNCKKIFTARTNDNRES
jgi:hypothetical protein